MNRCEDPRIQFFPGGRVVSVPSGTLLLEAAARAGFVVDTPCGGGGTCGKCRARFDSGAPEPGDDERACLSEENIAQGWRLACRARIVQDAVVYIPSTSLFGGRHQIQEHGETGSPRVADDDLREVVLHLAPPSLEDDAPDLTRIERALATQIEGWDAKSGLSVFPTALQSLPDALRQGNFRGTATLRGQRLIDFAPRLQTEPLYALAFDIGTTTLVGALLRLDTGEEVAVTSAMNPQTVYGDDVLSRIAFASENSGQLLEMQTCILDALRAITQRLCAEAGVSSKRIHRVACAGNTTMQHLLLGVNPAALGMIPFTPAVGRGVHVEGDVFGLDIHSEARSYVFPVIGGFVGGDTVAGLLATNLSRIDGPTLMIDIGTNGEIVLVAGQSLFAASTAAGPAFEGARISCGMRASDGAIEKVLIRDDVEFGLIGDAPPCGLCGSGLIDLCGQLLKRGLLGADGRLRDGAALDDEIPASLRARMRVNGEGGAEFVLHEGMGARISLTQRDVRELQLGAGAIRAGVNILLKQAGLRTEQLRQILIAGGFGSFIRRDNAQRIGLIPHELPRDAIRFVGNVAFSGAKWASVSHGAREQAEELARRTSHVELSRDPDFAMEYALAMQFPEVSD